MNHRISSISLGFLAAVLLAGCATSGPPRGNTGGSADPYRSTPADAYDSRVSSVTLLEFSDQVSDALAMRVGRVEAITEHPEKVVIYTGNIENRTATPSKDFEIARRRVFAGLVNSDAVSSHADIIEAPEGMDEQFRRLAPDGFGDRTGGYNPESIYVLQGYFGEIERGNGAQSTYYLEMTLTHLASSRIVFVEQFDQKQLR